MKAGRKIGEFQPIKVALSQKRPWLEPWKAILHSLVHRLCYSKLITKIWRKIHPHYQQQLLLHVVHLGSHRSVCEFDVHLSVIGILMLWEWDVVSVSNSGDRRNECCEQEWSEDWSLWDTTITQHRRLNWTDFDPMLIAAFLSGSKLRF